MKDAAEERRGGLHMENNQVTVTGTISKEREYDHSVYGEDFYRTELLTQRKSGTIDRIPLLISERILTPEVEIKGKLVKVMGHFCSYNKHEDGKSRVILSVFTEDLSFEEEDSCDNNSIYLDGYICKPPVYRKTPLGRQITDLLIAVNRLYEKSDYIPCVAWGRTAKWAGGLEVGSRVKLYGRIQSRVYQKTVSENCVEERTAYEVSVNFMILCRKEQSKNGKQQAL